MKITTLEKVRRHVTWRKAELYGGLQSECSCCFKFSRNTRYIDGPGFICFPCWMRGDRCAVEGCQEPACKHTGGVCRDHYVRDETVLRIEDFGGFGDSSLAALGDML
jgi:hypothetical protein